MLYEDLMIGMTVRIIDYEEYDSNRPEHWAPEMDEWQGAVVTIHHLVANDSRVFIEEDKQEWQWYPWDFESHETLEYDNPNIIYREVKRDRFIDELRAGWVKQQEERKKGKSIWPEGLLDKSN